MKTPAQPFPWAEAMGFAFVVLRLSPDAFWAMTPRELAAAIRFTTGGRDGPRAGRATLEALMQAFPDQHSFPDYPDRHEDQNARQ